jgi:hypothetical protein
MHRYVSERTVRVSQIAYRLAPTPVLAKHQKQSRQAASCQLPALFA